MSRQKTGQDRDLINNRRIYQDVADGARGMLACAGTSGRRNAAYGASEPSRGMMRGAVMDSSVGGCAAAAVRTGGGGPSDGRYAGAIKSADPDAVQESFEAQVSRQLGIMRDAGGIPRRGLTVAVDMHLICRYDRRPGGELTRSRYRDGTKYFERYMTAQCVDGGRRLVLAAHHVQMAESVPEHVGLVLDSLEGAGVRTRLLLLDREFFSVDVIAELQRRDAGFLVPCKNTGNVVAALREFDRKERHAVSKNVLENSAGSVRYDMLITKRKKKGGPVGRGKAGGKAEDEWIGFATNRPGADVGSYSARWGIETGYAKIEESRAKTRITGIGARMLCFYYSLVLLNEWTVVRMLLSDGTGGQSAMTMLTFKACLESILIEPEPPP